MAAAIKASLADTLKEDKEDSGSDLETFSDEDSNLQSSDTRSPVRNGAGGSKNGGVGVKNKPKLGEIERHKNGSAARGQTNGTNGSGEVDAKKGEKEKQTQEAEGWKAHLGEEGSETTTILIR